MIRSSKITESARDKPCFACGRNDGTTVWAHSNESIHGKGARIKAHDIFGAYLCSQCHYWYDQSPAPREEKREFFRRPMAESLVSLINDGIITISGYKPVGLY